MKLLTATTTAILVTAVLVLSTLAETPGNATPGLSPSGPAAEGAPSTPHPGSSGRPSAVLAEEECDKTWNEAAGESDTLTVENANRYIVNFKEADADQDAKISYTEFRDACAKGWVQAGLTASEADPSERDASNLPEAATDQQKIDH